MVPVPAGDGDGWSWVVTGHGYQPVDNLEQNPQAHMAHHLEWCRGHSETGRHERLEREDQQVGGCAVTLHRGFGLLRNDSLAGVLQVKVRVMYPALGSLRGELVEETANATSGEKTRLPARRHLWQSERAESTI